MPTIKANGIDIYYESHGDEAAETVLLIMGLGAQMSRWAPEFWGMLVDEGYRVVLYDNRDVGLSQKFEDAGPPDFAAILTARRAGEPSPAAYLLDDMAADAAGLLDALGIERAHIVGASMGGMIAQLVAADYPHKTLSLTSIMSTTGASEVSRATPEAAAVLVERGPDPREDFEGFLDHSVKSARVTAAPGYPFDPEAIRARARADYERSYSPVGFQRQYAAVMASPNRREKLRAVTAPTVVIHGEDDPLVPVGGGRDTAEHVAGAELRVYPGVGHDIPAAVQRNYINDILSVIARARA